MYRCKVCGAMYHHPDTAALCGKSHGLDQTPRHGMRYEVSCTDRGCYLNRNPVLYADAHIAEGLAGIHEERWREDPDGAHFCVLKDLNEVQTSQKPGATTGDVGGGGHG